MNSSNFKTPCGSSRKIGSFAVAAFLAVSGWSGSAVAGDCLATASGDPTLSCTANDFGVGSVTVTQLLDDGCTGPGDTFNFDGTLNVDGTSGGNADRYDVGFYIGLDGDQALTGTCTVGIIPQGFNDLDGDFCGDYTGGSTVSVPISNVVATCKDNDGDGFFDLAICTGYDNNANTTCSNASQAVPGTGSKCRCLTVPTNLEIPHCNVNGDCASDNNICTDEVCLGLNQPGADFFGCGHTNNTAPCPDGLFCNGVDVCAAGTCTHPGDPCVGGGVCGDLCNEADDNCFDPAGTLCRASSGVCDPAENCTGSTSTCPTNVFLPTSTTCRGAASVCDVAEQCTGTSGACPNDGFAGTSVTCRASSGICDPAEVCSGTNGNCPADGFLPTSTTCRASAGECDPAEQCTGTSGPCPGNAFDPNGEPCTPDSNVCTDDECNGVDATCHHPNNTDPCDDADACTDNDVCSGGSCAGSTINCDDQDDCTEDICVPQSGCVNNLICADICRSPGYWATHSGFEKEGSVNVAQELLDIVGPLQVCGQTISATSNEESPFLDGLKLTSDLEGLCMRTKGVHQRQLYRQLVAAALNCAASGATICDNVANTYMDVKFSDCSNLCAGNPPLVDPPTVGECIGQLDCFNNGGQVIDGKCATGTCPQEQVLTYCGGDFGSCPLIGEDPQECQAFENNCHAQEMCNEEINFCPKKTPASSPAACREARFNECTIDSCP